jgi:tetratricopeptide (TPR) repeat protein
MDKHPRKSTLARFGQGLSSRHQNRKLVRHLLAGCRACQAFTSRLFLGDGDYTAAFESARRAAEQLRTGLAQERAEAPEQLRALAAQPQERRIAAVLGNPAWRTWALCEAVLDAAQEWAFQDPARALDMARLGVEVASRLDTLRYGGERVNDLLARAWAVLGNAERVRTDFQAAGRCFEQAHRRLRAGTGDPLEKARVLLLEASLRGRQRRMPEAFRLLDRAATIGRRLGDPVLRGKARIVQGILAGTESEWERAIGLLREGISLLGPDAAAEPRLWVSAHHNLALVLTESGRHQEGMEILERTRPLYLQLGDRMSLIRLTWLEGHVQMALGDLARAEDLFLHVREELIRHGLGHDVGLLLLDLARVYTRQGKAVHLRRIAGEMLAIFRSRRVPDEVLSALILFRRAAEMEGITLGLIQELSDALRDGRTSAGSRLRESP